MGKAYLLRCMVSSHSRLKTWPDIALLGIDVQLKNIVYQAFAVINCTHLALRF